MDSRVQDWITTYKYGVGTIEQIKTGNLKTFLLKGDEDFQKLLSERTGLIIIPKVIGIYQYRTPKKESLKERKDRLYVENKMDELELRMIELEFGLQEKCHPRLIHVSCLESISHILNTALQDPAQRIKISQIERLPNFFDKDIYRFYELVDEEATLLEAKGEEPTSDEIKEILVKMAPEFKALYEHYSQFRFTRNEWVSIYKHFDYLD